MKIAVAAHGVFPDSYGGMERHSYNLVRYLSRNDVETHLLVPPVRDPSRYPFPVHSIPWPKRPMWLWSNYEFSLHVAHWLRTNRPDVAFGQGFALWAYLPKKEMPCIFHPHGLEMYGSALRWNEVPLALPFRSLVREHVRRSDVTISLGGRLTEILKDRVKTPEDRICEIPNAVDLETFPPSTGRREENSFLFVGRLAFNKGIDLLRRAVKMIRSDRFRLTLVGTGPERRSVEKWTRLDPRVRFIAGADDVKLGRLYRQHECLLFTSRFEGMPTVILEAMASGCAVIATRIGAVDQVVTNATGCLVAPTAEGIAEGIEGFLQLDPPHRKRLGREGRERVEQKFSWDRVIREYLDLFRQIRRSVS